ncbi:MAG: DUF58 domain-containing protein [Gemmatimonadota bacterium]|nr:DUF58 domain-containing protein [Gemmatimonadota bacterium]
MTAAARLRENAPSPASAGLARLRRISLPLPTRRVCALVLLVAPVWLLSGSESGRVLASLLSLLLLGAFLADAQAIPAASLLSLERELPETVGITEVAEGGYRIVSRWPHPLVFRVYDAFPSSVTREGVSPGRERLGARGEAVVPVAIRGRQRGAFPLGPVALRAQGPLGLAQRTLHYQLPDRITITPSISGVRRYRLLALQHRLRDAGVRTIRRRGEGTSFASLREYAPGDDPRHIDWKASARRRKLISREYSVEQGQTVIIAIDAGRMMTQLAGGISRFEHALSAATVLADVAIHSGDQVGLIVFDDQVRGFVPPMRGVGALQRIRQALIPLSPTMAEPDYALAFRTLASRHRRRSLIVLITDVIDPRASHAVMAHTARSVGRHLPVVVALRNDRLVEAALPGAATTPAELYASAAAEELVLARSDALSRMRQAGVSVLDVSPQKMTAAVINRYLEIKARSSL